MQVEFIEANFASQVTRQVHTGIRQVGFIGKQRDCGVGVIIADSFCCAHPSNPCAYNDDTLNRRSVAFKV